LGKLIREADQGAGTMFVFAYGVGAYLIFLLTFLYAIGFVENWIVSLTIDGAPGATGGGLGAFLANAVLLGLFAVQHSVMARQAFKRAWTRIVPPVIERSTFVLVSSLCLMLIFGRWRPIPTVVWDFSLHPLGFAVEMVSYAGWGLVLLSTVQLDHFELFGLKQVFFHARGEEMPPSRFKTPFLYRWVRHPIYLGFILAFWGAPRMTVGHLLFAGLTTGYILFAIRLEERDLARMHWQYRGYQSRVPMLLPVKEPLPATDQE
jgi:protein-S-isoprenylcysteine O-methyltransferase Ste14